jgi:hypothetical protein
VGEEWTLLPKFIYGDTTNNYAFCSDGSILSFAYKPFNDPTRHVFARGQFVTTGIDEPIFNTYGTLLYPNPATDNATLTLELQQASQVRISLNDMLGRELQ